MSITYKEVHKSHDMLVVGYYSCNHGSHIMYFNIPTRGVDGD